MTVATDIKINGQVTLKTLQAEGVARKKPSEKLLNAINSLGKEAAGYFKKLEDRINEVLDLGRKEGFTDLQIGDWIRTETKEHYSKMTIARLLPPTAKHMEKARFGNKMLPNTPLGRTVEGLKNEGISSSPPLSDEIKIPPITYTIQDAEVVSGQPTEPKSHSESSSFTGSEGQEVEQEGEVINRDILDVDNVNNYSLEYLREVVKELYDNNTQLIGRIKYWGSVNEDLRKEINCLKTDNSKIKKENEEYKRLPDNDWLYNRIDLLKKENTQLKEQLNELKSRNGRPEVSQQPDDQDYDR